MHPSYCDGYSRLNTKRQALKEERHQQSHRRGPFFNVPFIAFLILQNQVFSLIVIPVERPSLNPRLGTSLL